MSRRIQFSLKWLLIVTAIAAAFFGGMATQKLIDQPAIRQIDMHVYADGSPMKRIETMVMRDGTVWSRELPD
jgi:hypothetical protein